jgi:hypothetical protein
MTTSRQRLIHFERYDDDDPCDFYCGYHELKNFSQEEQREFDDCKMELFGPNIPFYREFEFFLALIPFSTGGPYRSKWE